MPDDPNPALIQQASEGNTTALDSLLERHLPGLLSYVRLHCGQLLQEKETVADLAQSVCREVLEDMDTFEYRGEAPFRKWLFAKAASKIVDRHRYYLAEKRNPAREEGARDDSHWSDLADLAASFVSPSQAAIRGEDLDRLEQVFQQLPEDYRQVISLARIIGYSRAEIAKEMGRSEGAVRNLLHRALARVAWLMSEPQEPAREADV